MVLPPRSQVNAEHPCVPHSVCPSHSSPPLWFSPGRFTIFMSLRASLVAQKMKKLADTRVGKILWRRELGRLQSMELRISHD